MSGFPPRSENHATMMVPSRASRTNGSSSLVGLLTDSSAGCVGPGTLVFAISLYPWRPSDAHWRFGAVGMLSNALLIPTAGLLVALATALVLNHTMLQRAIGVVGLVVAGLCVVALAMFALDSIQTRAAVPPEMRLSFNLAALTPAGKN